VELTPGGDPSRAGSEPVRAVIRACATDDLAPAEIRDLRRLLRGAFEDDEGGFTEHDWQHGLGGLHFLAQLDGRIVGHAAVGRRPIGIGERILRAGYVEAVAVARDLRRRGVGSALMRAANERIAQAFEIGVLATGSPSFYERIGWEVWRGPSFVREADGLRPTPDEDGFILVLRTPATPPLDVTAPITCDPRPGDDW
jgi:aminoglycoside 2'-N-acetyltransferase I